MAHADCPECGEHFRTPSQKGVDVADAVLDFLRTQPGALSGTGDPALCHGNLLPEHAGMADGTVACVIDFEHALAGPPEYDYWRTAMPLAGDHGDETVAALREGYESVGSLPDGFDRRKRLYWTVNAVSYLAALHLQGNVTGEDAERGTAWLREYVFDSLAELS